MTAVGRKNGDDLYVDTEALRRDASTWEDEARRLQEGRESISLSCVSRLTRSDIVTSKCMDMISRFVTYCSQGESEFFSTASSLKQAANDYEANEEEIF